MLMLKKKLTFTMAMLTEKLDLNLEFKQLLAEGKLDKHSIRTYKDMIYFRE